MRFFAIIMASTATVAAAAPTEQDGINRGPAPVWAVPSELLAVPDNVGGAVFFRRQDVIVHLDDKGQSQYQGYRVKILQATALQIGNLSLAWNPGAGAPTVHSLKMFRDGQLIDLLPSAKFDILRREDQLEAAKLDGTLTAVFRVPDLRVGDELELQVTTPTSDPTLGRDAAGLVVTSVNEV